jgi:uracil-DNA glycosylase family 4
MPDRLTLLEREIVACRRCPRLVAWREQVGREKRRAFREDTYWARPVPGFGDPRARLLIIGLAPGAHGANRTGRMFTGDSSGDFLYPALFRAGLASAPVSRGREDGLALVGCFIAAAARCAPPDNKPTRDELAACNPFLARELALLPDLQAVLALGAVALAAYFEAARAPRPRPRFAHGLEVPGRPAVIASYHVSRQNTNTGRLTAAMFDAVLARAKRLAGL